MKVLFVGGSLDGRRWVLSREIVRYEVLVKTEDGIRSEWYRRKSFTIDDGAGDFEIMALDGEAFHDTMRLLVEGYRPDQPKP